MGMGPILWGCVMDTVCIVRNYAADTAILTHVGSLFSCHKDCFMTDLSEYSYSAGDARPPEGDPVSEAGCDHCDHRDDINTKITGDHSCRKRQFTPLHKAWSLTINNPTD